MAAPTFVAERGPAVWNNSTSPKASSAFTPASGDVLVGVALAENSTPQVNLTGGGLTWTVQQSIAVSNYCFAQAATAIGTGGSVTGSFAEAATSANYWGADLLQFSGSDGVGASAKTNVASGAPSLDITTTQDNSAIVVIVGDWAEVDGSSRVWRTVNGSGPTELAYAQLAGRYVAYAAYYADAGTAGVKTVGISSPAGMKYSIIAVEVLGSAGSSGQTVSPTGIASTEAFGTAVVTPGQVTVSPSAIATAETFGTATVTPGPVTVSPSGTSTSETFGTAVITPGPVTVSPSRIGTGEAFGTAVVTVDGGAQTVSPSGIGTGETFGAATVTPGPVTVTPSGIGTAETFGTATIVPGPVTVSPTGIASGGTLGTATVTPGPVTITPSGIVTGAAFGTAVITTAGGGQTITPPGISTGTAFGTAVVTPGPVTVSPSSISTGAAFGAAVVTAAKWILRIPATREGFRVNAATKGARAALFSRVVTPGVPPAVLVTAGVVEEVFAPTVAQVNAADYAFMGGHENVVPDEIIDLILAAGYELVPG